MLGKEQKEHFMVGLMNGIRYLMVAHVIQLAAFSLCNVA